MGTLFIDIAPDDRLKVTHGDVQIVISLEYKTGRKARLKVIAEKDVEIKLDR